MFWKDELKRLKCPVRIDSPRESLGLCMESAYINLFLSQINKNPQSRPSLGFRKTIFSTVILEYLKENLPHNRVLTR